MNSFLSKVGYSAIYIYIEFFIGLVASILIARSLGPEEYGLYSYLIKLSAVLMLFVNGGVSTGVLRFLAEYTHNVEQPKIVAFNVYKFFSKIQLFKCLVVLACFFVIFHELFDLVIEPENEYLMLLFVAGVVFKSYYMFRVGALKGLERFDSLAWMVILVCPLYLVLVVVGWQNQYDIEYYSLVYLFVSFLFWLVSFLLIKKHFKRGDVELANNFESRAKSYIRVVTVNTVLAALIIGYIEIFFLKYFNLDVEIGFFNIGLTIAAAAVSLVPGIYNSILMPAIVKNSVENEGKKTEDSKRFVFGTIRHMLVLTLFVAVPAAFYADELINLLYGTEYLSAVFPLFMMLLASIATAFTYPAVAYFVSKDRQGDMLKVHAAVLALSVTWGYFLISNYGLKGAVISYVVTNSATALCLIVMLIRDFRSVAHPMLFLKTGITAAIAIGVLKVVPLNLPLFIEIITGSVIYASLFIALAYFLKIFTEEERAAMAKIVAKFKR
ncbi:MAG: oligosaccharide flippase family protein [Pseudomonadales bacterium]|nr:oligosaccharide flippase family protein [Pseudomonadales bacterium]